MSIFQKIYYRALKLYHQAIIASNHLVYIPLTQIYDSLFTGGVVKVVLHNDLSWYVTFKYDVMQLSYYISLYLMKRGPDFKRDWLVTKYSAPTGENIHDITCWDGKRYLTRREFNITERRVSTTRTRLLYAYLCFVGTDATCNIDITEFMNRYATSFVQCENLRIVDLLPVLYAQQLLNINDLYNALVHPQICIQAMDSITLNEITFKDNCIVIL